MNDFRKPDVVEFHVKKTVKYVVDLSQSEPTVKEEDGFDGMLDAILLFAEGEMVSEYDQGNGLTNDKDDIEAILRSAPIANIMLPDDEIDEDGELRLFYRDF